MISAEKGKVMFSGAKNEVQVEFMTIVEQAAKNGLFDDESDLMMAVTFALLSKSEQTEILKTMLDEMIDDLKKGLKE